MSKEEDNKQYFKDIKKRKEYEKLIFNRGWNEALQEAISKIEDWNNIYGLPIIEILKRLEALRKKD